MKWLIVIISIVIGLALGESWDNIPGKSYPLAKYNHCISDWTPSPLLTGRRDNVTCNALRQDYGKPVTIRSEYTIVDTDGTKLDPYSQKNMWACVAGRYSCFTSINGVLAMVVTGAVLYGFYELIQRASEQRQS